MLFVPRKSTDITWNITNFDNFYIKNLIMLHNCEQTPWYFL